MAQPLMPIVPLLFGAAVAQPPVSAERVTGNIHTERSRQTSPLPDPCRVTGNIVGGATKAPPSCHLTTRDRTVPLRGYTYDPEDHTRCVATGQLETTPAGQVCTVTDGWGGTQSFSWPLLPPVCEASS